MPSRTIAFTYLGIIAVAFFISISVGAGGREYASENEASREEYLATPYFLLSTLEGGIDEKKELQEEVPSAGTDIAFLHAAGKEVFYRKNSVEPAPLPLREGLVADLLIGEVYWSQSPGKRWPIASITKLVTAAYAADHLEKDKAIALTEEMFSALGDAQGYGLKAGETYSAEDLIRAMLLFSSNEAAEALANDYGRGRFIAGMNEEAKQWGLRDTHFDDPTGLSSANQSTPHDLTAIVLHLYQSYPELFAITREKALPLVEQNSGTALVFPNINQFAGRKDFLGGKTGYTNEAGENLVSLFAYENRPVVIVVLGSSDRFGVTESLFDWFKETHTSNPGSSH